MIRVCLLLFVYARSLSRVAHARVSLSSTQATSKCGGVIVAKRTASLYESSVPPYCASINTISYLVHYFADSKESKNKVVSEGHFKRTIFFFCTCCKKNGQQGMHVIMSSIGKRGRENRSFEIAPKKLLRSTVRRNNNKKTSYEY